VHPRWSDECLQFSNIALNLGAAWPQIPRPSSSSPRQRHSQQFISRAKEKGVRHGSIIESPNREAQTGTESLRHILVVDDDPMVCMAIEVYLQRNDFRVTIAEGGKPDFARSNTSSSI
jgi:PleD family two-component response regulator